MVEDILFIVNPVAGHGRSRRVFEPLKAVLLRRKALRMVVWETRGPRHAWHLAEQAVREGFPRVVAVGGDGTVHEVINGMLGAGPETARASALGVVPAGSGNDFARNLGVPTDPAALARFLVEAPAGPLDVGQIDGHYFANVAGIGFDAEVARAANRVPKFLPGSVTYVACALWMLAAYRNATMRIRLDGKPLERRGLLLAVGNGARYGGGLNICPGAVMNDGRFRVMLAGDVSRPEVLQLLPLVYTGRHVQHPKVEVFDAATVTIETDRVLSVQADGEIVATTPATLRVMPGALLAIGCPPAGAEPGGGTMHRVDAATSGKDATAAGG